MGNIFNILQRQTALNLYGNEIGEKGAIELAEALKKINHYKL